MDTMSAFANGQSGRDNNDPMMVFDWDKAARLIKERRPKSASAGLRSDWEYTGGSIFENGKPVPKVDTYTFLSSIWATPELDLDGDIVECFIIDENSDWNEHTYWPESALTILNG